MEAQDPENETGTECVGYFRWDDEYGTASLIGIRVDDGARPVRWFRDIAAKHLLGADAVDRVECVVTQDRLDNPPEYGADYAYDLWKETA